MAGQIREPDWGQIFRERAGKVPSFELVLLPFLLCVMHGKIGFFIDFESEMVENNCSHFDKTGDKMLFSSQWHNFLASLARLF